VARGDLVHGAGVRSTGVFGCTQTNQESEWRIGLTCDVNSIAQLSTDSRQTFYSGPRFDKLLANMNRNYSMSQKTMTVLGTPQAGSLYLNSLKMPWEPTEIEGYSLKRLYEDSERGEITCLFRMDPGAIANRHAHHDEFEQVYVLEGSFNDGEQTLVAGDYVFRAPGAMHEGSTQDGALMLVMFSKADPR
jgi:quercetin dioxygenase-like cupin family protein